LQVEDVKLDEIATELSNTSGLDADAPPSIKYWLHQIKLGRTDHLTQHVGGRPPLDSIKAEIISILRQFPFSSVRTIAGSLNIPASIISIHLVEKIGLKNLLLRWVPHALTSELRQKRVELAGQ
jgi:hypothetical protein